MFKHSLWAIPILLIAAASRAADDSHKAPIEAQAPTEHEQRQATLAEMWQRRLIPPDSGSFTPQDEDLLAKVHEAEAAGAVRYLRARGPLGGLIVELRGKYGKTPRLTKAGYERWRMMRTQDAIRFFQSKDIGAVDAFKLKDL